MSCWVVPTLAAEFWRLSLEQVLQSIREGTVQTKVEHGFTFVDVAPSSPQHIPQPPPKETPLTYVPVTREELAALTEDLDIPQDEEEKQPEEPSLRPWSWTEPRRIATERRRAPAAA